MSRRNGIMLAVPFEEKRLAKWEPPYIVQPKYDGNRCINLPLEDSSLLLTSEENPFFSVPHINQQLKDGGLYKVPLDGELYNHDIYLEGGHELIHSIVSRTVNLHPRYKEMEFHVFDLKLSMLQMKRTVDLASLRLPYAHNVRIAPFWICYSLYEIKQIYDKLIKKGYEGIVVRHCKAPYVEGRSIGMMKFKPKRKDTYPIVGWKEERTIDGVAKGIIGSIICATKKGEEFAIGAGLNDWQKAKLWKIKEDLSGKTAIIHYQHLTNKEIPKGSFDVEIPELGID